MDTDSLYKRRVSQFLKQPDTVRGNAIMWYANQEKRPVKIVATIAGLTVIVLVHVLTFVLLLRDYISGVRLFKNLCYLVFLIYSCDYSYTIGACTLFHCRSYCC